MKKIISTLLVAVLLISMTSLFVNASEPDVVLGLTTDKNAANLNDIIKVSVSLDAINNGKHITYLGYNVSFDESVLGYVAYTPVEKNVQRLQYGKLAAFSMGTYDDASSYVNNGLINYTGLHDEQTLGYLVDAESLTWYDNQILTNSKLKVLTDAQVQTTITIEYITGPADIGYLTGANRNTLSTTMGSVVLNLNGYDPNAADEKTVSFNAGLGNGFNGKVQNMPAAQQVEVDDTLVLSTLDVPTCSIGFMEFAGWSLTKNGEVLTTDPVITDDITLYAIWENNTNFGRMAIVKGTETAGTVNFRIYLGVNITDLSAYTDAGMIFAADEQITANQYITGHKRNQMKTVNLLFSKFVEGGETYNAWDDFGAKYIVCFEVTDFDKNYADTDMRIQGVLAAAGNPYPAVYDAGYVISTLNTMLAGQ